MTDLVLSSGFLAFARHVGFLHGIEDRAIEPEAIIGTSSGALAGALWAAGHSAQKIGELLSADRPIAFLRPRITPWSGLLSMDPFVARLKEWLPLTFAELKVPFAAGVIGADKRHRLLTEGPLPEAVAASCAMPWIFGAVRVGDAPYRDGGAFDRLGLEAWRSWRGPRAGVVHWVERTAGAEVEADLTGLTIVRTPRSGAKLWDLGEFWVQVEDARALTLVNLDGRKRQ